VEFEWRIDAKQRHLPTELMRQGANCGARLIGELHTRVPKVPRGIDLSAEAIKLLTRAVVESILK
jgi:hypothetical protein